MHVQNQLDYPYAPKETPIYGSAFNHFYEYFKKNNTQPNFFESKIRIEDSIIDDIKKLGGKQLFIHYGEYKSNNSKTEKTHELVLEYKDAIIILLLTQYGNHHSMIDREDDEESKSRYFCKILYNNEEVLSEIKSLFKYVEEKNKKNVYLLCKSEGMLVTEKFKIKLPEEEMDLELNYGEELETKKEILIDKLNQNKSGLALFSGPPGTGKSTFIKYLSTQTSRKIIYLPSTAANELTDPGFLTFMSDYKNCILLLEDAEKILISREIQENHAVSNILNMTDGLLGDCLNIFIIATFNTTKDKIDSALLRKGRLVLEHEFAELPVDNCNRIFKKLGLDATTDRPLPLAEIYNQDDNFIKLEKEKQKIGF